MTLLPKLLTTLATTFFLCISTVSLEAKNRVILQQKKHSQFYTGIIEMAKDPDIQGMDGGGFLDCYVSLKSPKEHEGQRIQILISDHDRSNFPRLATQSERIVFRVRSGAIKKDTRYLYESEVNTAFTPDRLPPNFHCVSELDRYIDVPKGPLPAFPKTLSDDPSFRKNICRFLIFIDEKGKLRKELPLTKSPKAIKAATRQYLENARFKIGKKDGKPVPYYTEVSMLFTK